MENAVEPAAGHEFQRITFSTPQRGGLLGQGSVLTVSANNLMWLWERALAVDRKKIEQFRKDNRLTALSGYLAQCLYGK